MLEYNNLLLPTCIRVKVISGSGLICMLFHNGDDLVPIYVTFLYQCSIPVFDGMN